MDWSVPSEMIEALECAGSDSHTNLQEENNEEAERCKLNPSALECKEEGGVFTAVDDILASFCDAGEKFFVSVSSWVPWKNDDTHPLPSPNCPLHSQREIQLIERAFTLHYSPECAHCKVNMDSSMEQEIVQQKKRKSNAVD